MGPLIWLRFYETLNCEYEMGMEHATQISIGKLSTDNNKRVHTSGRQLNFVVEIPFLVFFDLISVHKLKINHQILLL